MKHIFLEKISEYDLKLRDITLSKFHYSNSYGYWVDENQKPCILNPNFSKPRTKKEDRETGEDQKGE